MTATPRVYNDSAKDKTKENDVLLFSMDDEEIFGKEVYAMRFDEAIRNDLLCDYRVIISYMSESYINSFTNQKAKAQEKSDLTLEDGKMVGVYKALRKENMFLISREGEFKPAFSDDKSPMKRAIAFHSSIKKSKFIKDNFHLVDSDIKDKDIIDHIDGSDNANIKARKLSWLKLEDQDTPFRILSNAKCLTEGIDVPSLDAVAFFDPRDSVVDIVQAVGRAMRKAPGKKYGYIILPIMLNDEEIKNYDETIKKDKFKGVWKVLKALRSHDESLVDIKRIDEVLSVTTSGDCRQEMPEPSLFSLADFVDEMKGAIPKHLGDLEYWESYAKKVGEVFHNLTSRIESLLKDNPKTIALFENFCKALQANINASFDSKEAISLIAQHITIQPIFDHLFPNIDFSKFDKVSSELTKLYNTIKEFGLDSEIASLESFYKSVQSTANYAQSDKSRQNLIKSLYATLFKSAFKKTQEKLGIVYTPIEVVDFIIHSVSFALQKHFDKNLSDKDVHICDPFTGTGTFITRLIQSGLLDSTLEHKYKNELWANEITLLAYYIAQINITSTYHERLSHINKTQNNTQEITDYTLLDNLLYTDTFNTYMPESKGFKGARKGEQRLFQGDYLAHNYQKIQDFKNTPFKVIIGNPPYSANQSNSNDNNANESYPFLESRIKETYIAKTASNNQSKVYDHYKMAIRYASDRIESSGVIGFVTNGSFIDGNADSGLRACLEEEFDYVYIFNLRGNQRTSGETSKKEGGKIFDSGSRAPIAISILIKNTPLSQNLDSNKPSKKAEIYYYDIGDYLTRQEKLDIIQNFKSIESIPFNQIKPNQDYDWINQRDYSFLKYIPLGSTAQKLKPLIPNKQGQIELEIFEIFSQGIQTGGDNWLYNFSKTELAKNMQTFIATFNLETQKFKGQKLKEYNELLCKDKTKITWSESLKAKITRGEIQYLQHQKIIISIYRPFCKEYLYYEKYLNHRQSKNHQIYPTATPTNIDIFDLAANEEHLIKNFVETYKYLPNISITINGIGSNKEFSALITQHIIESGTLSNSQCFPLYYYERIESDTRKSGTQTQMHFQDSSKILESTPDTTYI